MIAYHQTADTFHVEEELFYQPSGNGSYVFVKIRKQNRSTFDVKRRISERTGVSVKHIRHAGMKDTAATATQWLSWPEPFQKQELRDLDDITILEQSRHDNNLSVGHVRRNRFRVILEMDENPPSEKRLSSFFPNFYGRQRFGRNTLRNDLVAEKILWPTKNQVSISVMQSWLFNEYFRKRLNHHGNSPCPDDLWTAANGKRYFQSEIDPTLTARFEAGEITPTGPIYGYKVRLIKPEADFLRKVGVNPELFRRWGKIARGARRALFVKPDIESITSDEKGTTIIFSLPSGAYGTVFLTYLFQPQTLYGPLSSWPDFTHKVRLDGEEQTGAFASRGPFRNQASSKPFGALPGSPNRKGSFYPR